MTDTNSTTYSNSLAPCANIGVIAIPFRVTPAGAAASADTINLCKLPRGFQPVGMSITTDKAVASTGGTLKVGLFDGVADDDDALIPSTVATGAVSVTRGINVAVGTRTTVEPTAVRATLGVGSGASSDITYSGFVLATTFVA